MNHWWQWLLKPENLSAVSTAASALIATVAILFTAFGAFQQRRRYRRERTPVLIVTDADWTKDGFEFKFANLGTSPIFLAGIVHDKYGGDYRFKNPGLLLQPGTIEPFELETLPVLASEKGEFRLMFQYGLTGSVYHRLAFPYSISTEFDLATMTMPLKQHLDIPLWKQKLKTNLGDDYEILERNLLAEEVFKP